MEKCFVYLRRSQDREDRQQLSIDKQDAQVREIIKNHGFAGIQLPPEERSAKYPGRPIFNDMLERIYSGEAKYIAVWATSRLSRNPIDGGAIIYALDTGKLHAIYTPTKVYRNTSEDKMMLGIEFAFAKKNNDDLSVQVREGFETKRRHGQYPGPAPIGYRNAMISLGERNIEPDPVYAPLVVQLFQAAASGRYSLHDLWIYAFEIGIRSKRDKRLAKQTVAEVLKRRLYTGVFKYGGDEWHKGTYQPLIGVDLYDQVQYQMGWTRKRVIGASTSGRFYPYKGVLICETCRFNITAYTKKKSLKNGDTAEYIFYSCTKKSKFVDCTEPQIPDSELKNAIREQFERYEITEDEALACSRYLEVFYDDYINQKYKRLEKARAEKRQAEKNLNTLDEKLETGVIDDSRYKLRSAIHLEIIARTSQQLEESDDDAKRWLELAKEVFSRAINLADVFDMANDDEKRQLMTYLGSNWSLGNKKVALKVRKPLHLLDSSNRNLDWRARPDLNRRSPP